MASSGAYVYNVGGGALKNVTSSSKGWKSLIGSKTTTYREGRDGARMQPVEGEIVGSRQERRRSSVSGSSDVGLTALLEAKVLVTDMPEFMQAHAFRCARTAYHHHSQKQMAYCIKKEFDKVYGPAWHCIVGSAFGSFVTHTTGCFLYFSFEKLYILIFKTKIQRLAPC